MKKDCIKYITCLFFIALFSIKGVVSVSSSWAEFFNLDAIEMLVAEEAEESRKTTEESKENESKHYYAPHNYNIHVSVISDNITAKIVAANNIHFKEDVILSVTTPPPELI